MLARRITSKAKRISANIENAMKAARLVVESMSSMIRLL